MYFTTLPDHSQPGFDEQAHFTKFKEHNIIFNALSTDKHCDDHVGCLSIKTVLCGEERYGTNNRHWTVRRGQFLILNDSQNYSCHIDRNVTARTVSIFFKKDFATQVFHDVLQKEQDSLDNPFGNDGLPPEFFQTLIDIDPLLQSQLTSLMCTLDEVGFDQDKTDECLIFILLHLIQVHKSESKKSMEVKALRASTRMEVYKRLCIAKDLLHSNYMDKQDLQSIGRTAGLSVPQLVRQFKSVFKVTPHQYLMRIRLQRATELLMNQTDRSIQAIAWKIGFENPSAFGRAFKSMYGVVPGQYHRK